MFGWQGFCIKSHTLTSGERMAVYYSFKIVNPFHGLNGTVAVSKG